MNAIKQPWTWWTRIIFNDNLCRQYARILKFHYLRQHFSFQLLDLCMTINKHVICANMNTSLNLKVSFLLRIAFQSLPWITFRKKTSFLILKYFIHFILFCYEILLFPKVLWVVNSKIWKHQWFFFHCQAYHRMLILDFHLTSKSFKK